MVFFSDQDGKQGIYNCWPNGPERVTKQHNVILKH